MKTVVIGSYAMLHSDTSFARIMRDAKISKHQQEEAARAAAAAQQSTGLTPKFIANSHGKRNSLNRVLDNVTIPKNDDIPPRPRRRLKSQRQKLEIISNNNIKNIKNINIDRKTSKLFKTIQHEKKNQYIINNNKKRRKPNMRHLASLDSYNNDNSNGNNVHIIQIDNRDVFDSLKEGGGGGRGEISDIDKEYWKNTALINYLYATKHSYSYSYIKPFLINSVFFEYSIEWSKLFVINSLLNFDSNINENDYILYLDSDAVIFEHSMTFEQILEAITSTNKNNDNENGNGSDRVYPCTTVHTQESDRKNTARTELKLNITNKNDRVNTNYKKCMFSNQNQATTSTNNNDNKNSLSLILSNEYYIKDIFNKQNNDNIINTGVLFIQKNNFTIDFFDKLLYEYILFSNQCNFCKKKPPFEQGCIQSYLLNENSNKKEKFRPSHLNLNLNLNTNDEDTAENILDLNLSHYKWSDNIFITDMLNINTPNGKYIKHFWGFWQQVNQRESDIPQILTSVLHSTLNSANNQKFNDKQVFSIDDDDKKEIDLLKEKYLREIDEKHVKCVTVDDQFVVNNIECV